MESLLGPITEKNIQRHFGSERLLCFILTLKDMRDTDPADDEIEHRDTDPLTDPLDNDIEHHEVQEANLFCFFMFLILLSCLRLCALCRKKHQETTSMSQQMCDFVKLNSCIATFLFLHWSGFGIDSSTTYNVSANTYSVLVDVVGSQST